MLEIGLVVMQWDFSLGCRPFMVSWNSFAILFIHQYDMLLKDIQTFILSWLRKLNTFADVWDEKHAFTSIQTLMTSRNKRLDSPQETHLHLYLRYWIFAKRLLSTIQNINFRKVKCPLQRKLSSDIQTNIKNSNILLVPADKTSNFYKMDYLVFW